MDTELFLKNIQRFFLSFLLASVVLNNMNFNFNETDFSEKFSISGHSKAIINWILLLTFPDLDILPIWKQ